MNIDFGRFWGHHLNADKSDMTRFYSIKLSFKYQHTFVHFVVSSYKPDTECYKEVVAHFDQIAQEELGRKITNPTTGEIDRKTLGEFGGISVWE